MSPLFSLPHTKRSASQKSWNPKDPKMPRKRVNYNFSAKLIATLNLESIGVGLRQRQMTCLQKHRGLKNYLPETRSEPIH